MISGHTRKSIWFFVTPGLLLMTFLLAWPIAQGVMAAFREGSSQVGSSDGFVGLKNFEALLTNPAFWSSLKLAVSFTAVTTVIEMSIGLGVALFLYFQKPMYRLVEVLLILPMFVLPVVSGLTFRYIFDPGNGPFSEWFDKLGWEPISLLGDPFWAFWAIVFQDVWRMWPFVFLIIYGGLKAQSKVGQEAAKIDGASTSQIIYHVILPALKPTLIVACGLKITESLKAFTEIYVMTGGGPGDSTTLLSIFVVKQAFHFFHVGEASASSIILLLLGAGLAFSVTKYQNRPKSEVSQ
jgi:multiple sugar transport system permease protein